MGTLTGGIAHEFNNFLTPITGYADLIMADADPGSEIYDNAMEISEAAQKAQEVVKQISSMSRKNVETVYDAVSVEGLLHRTRKLVETNCPKNVALKEENELSGECVLGNATQLQQVLLNISINAIHAIGAEGGKLTIRGSVVPRRELEALFPEEKISEEWPNYVCLSVTDTGCGMDKETMQHIFEPFFTTKKTGEGTGLGLALADQIIRTHRGRIRAESTIGRGTTFYVYLPVLEQQQEREQLQWGVDSKLRILAADDNNKVLDLLDKDLSALGLSVSTCSRRGELRQLLEQQPFDVLAIDESLAGSSGVDFCMAIRGRYPGMTRIVMTNSPTREIVDARSHGVIDGYVVKPVSASTLLAQIRSSRKE
jgi:CheY-like chemotaxis protein